MAENKDPNRIIIKNARLGYPQLVTPKGFGGGDANPKYSACLILDKATQADQIKAIRAHAEKMCKEDLKSKIPPERLCIRDGTARDGKDGFGETVEFVNSSTPTNRPPQIVGRDRQPMDPGDKRLFPGCRVNACVRLWAQNNKEGGKRINASLELIQYVGPDQMFGTPPPEADAVFDEIPDEESVCDLG